MIQITDKKNCCGCSACTLVCPKHCIRMSQDNEGFLYPIVKEANCIGCGLCERVCHELHPFAKQSPLKVYAAINKDDQIRLNSSSGGIFYLLAEKTITAGGVVFGARFDEQWQVVIGYAETIDGIRTFMGSKYVQARIETAYTDAKQFLQKGRKVLFSGTPCQIAGLYHFLKKDYDNLLTVDVICHGAPSPKVWGRYLDEVVTAGRKAIEDVQFRNKRNGWKQFNFIMNYNEDERSISLCSCHKDNHYMRAFLSDIILRPSCHDCKAKHGRSHSDITLADCWGIKSEMPEMDDDKGTSLVFVNTDKGYAALDWSKITHIETTAEKVIKHNPAYYLSVAANPKREDFFIRLDESDSIISLINDFLRLTLKKSLSSYLSTYKQLLKKMLIRIVFDLRGGDRVTNEEWLTTIPSILDNTCVSAITFRNKEQGWKSYRMEIVIKA